ncbi:MAG: phosphatase PAP2 family protein [Steroidobacteraceae bacterium]
MPQAPTSSLGVWFARVDAAEYRICRSLNQGAAFPLPRLIFQVASRLGDGIVWYVLILALPALYGREALRPAAVMALMGALGVIVYKVLKRLFVRERPFITHAAIDPAMPPPDRYSFPSGHTLHAVCFTLQASVHFPQLGMVLIPLALMIAGSRVVLGLHYPTDILAGAAVGASLGVLGLSLS